MSRKKDRRFCNVDVNPSASALFQSVSEVGKSPEVNDSSRPLPSYFALNFNFKPESTHSSSRGALFQPSTSRSAGAEWQLELESNEPQDPHIQSSSDGHNEAAKKQKGAHVFTGPQTTAKSYDLVLIWDEVQKVYKLERLASTFSFKYERGKTMLSGASQDVWASDAIKSRKRSIDDAFVARSIASGSGSQNRRREARTSVSTKYESEEASRTSTNLTVSTSNPGSGGLKLRSKPTTTVRTIHPPVRRSSRRSIAVDMEEFDDAPPVISDPPPSANTAASSRTKCGDTTKDLNARAAEPESKETKALSHRTSLQSAQEAAPSLEPAGGAPLRRSRRRSSQAHTEGVTTNPLQRKCTPSATSEAGAAKGKVSKRTTEEEEAEEDNLALELERELEREFEMEMEDASDRDEPGASASPAVLEQTTTADRALSPVSCLKRGEMGAKINSPKAHTPDPLVDFSATSSNDSLSPLAEHTIPAVATVKTASIGLGLHQTGVGITPTTSPALGIAPSPISNAPSPTSSGRTSDLAFASTQPQSAVAGEDEGEDEDEDDLEDFAAELELGLDMSITEVADAEPSSPAPVATFADKRRSSRAQTVAQSERQQQGRKTYGLGGPRQEEEELEDSD
ncbi:uncharacterized protein MEPE_01743 [Melanopsichium pennsylvanicum]|uniref:Transcription elongation factor Eaf N-terminal domain-containing protein n=2 Tax=Melanopsichium pennsylvanicum TaxID=63383 RepID=A0AAJ4XJ90_9BASI|nr:putative protein [Melanopsichium pennsylvanicum 4]SNX83037.1 uncharacterized protein MEPE_01743 [Melanopsichium pennsylvanicum]